MEQTRFSTLADRILGRLFSNLDPDFADSVVELMEEILTTGRAILTVREGDTLSQAVDRLPSELHQSQRLALMVLYSPLHPMLMSDLASLTHFTCKCDPEADIRWCSAASDFLSDGSFVIVILSQTK